MSDSAALDSFLQKWRARWPEWSVAEIFVAPARRDIAVAWFALLQEFDDVLNVSGDPLPADAKLAWWSEELRGWANQRSRHPLGRRLEPERAAWGQLADALPTLVAARTQPVDEQAAFAALAAYGDAVAAVEGAVLGRAPTPRAVIAQMLATRLAEAGSAAVPGRDAGAEAGLRGWAMTLQQAWGNPRHGARERRILSAYARARLHRHARQGAPAPLPGQARLLFTGWRAARGD
ncbi:squalene/phytoene synthase family protein [Pseudoxanthomonas sp. PXM02]|uniref:squalene/phytoene synthase family protein n=1 Tax=Pseudoxanthomonas sp. PXM02 TaxID=2769294 RepID=UPI00177BF599|nr:squalene/phytoene synthase family protein [Pseudoxanthomonas sp. PXM02]MBD9477766.1 phytoene/squalene synthase family protein [Pseudoxanthomonas sp. PXM02]